MQEKAEKSPGHAVPGSRLVATGIGEGRYIRVCGEWQAWRRAFSGGKERAGRSSPRKPQVKAARLSVGKAVGSGAARPGGAGPLC